MIGGEDNPCWTSLTPAQIQWQLLHLFREETTTFQSPFRTDVRIWQENEAYPGSHWQLAPVTAQPLAEQGLEQCKVENMFNKSASAVTGCSLVPSGRHDDHQTSSTVVL